MTARNVALLLGIVMVLGISLALLGRGAESPPSSTELTAPGRSEAGRGETAAPGTNTTAPAIGAVVIPREPAAPLRPADAPPRTADGQGLRGLVIDEQGQPLVDVVVHLLESAANEPLAAQLLQQPDAMTPLVSVRSDASGSFALGLPVVQDRQYELCCVSPRHALLRVGPYRLLAGEWHDLGAIILQRGAALRGRVTVAGHDDIGVPGATVRVEVGVSFADAIADALPDGVPGRSAVTDGSGYYQLEHAPSRGIVQVTAVAPGFARIVRRDVRLTNEAPLQLDFALPAGQSVQGRVTDDVGTPVADARVQAFPLRAPATPLVTHTDERGEFVLHGLMPETYRVAVRATHHEPAEQSPVAPGSNALRFVLTPRGAISLRVVTPTGDIVRAYRVALRRWFDAPPNPPQIGAVPEVPERLVRLGPGGERLTMPDLPNGLFVCEVEADGAAKTLSRVIDNRRDPALPPPARWHDVEVVLGPGATLRGRVVDEGGLPLAGATVMTMPDGTQPDSPLFRLLSAALPTRITARTARSDVDGQFELVHLAGGEYQLHVEHPDACREIVRNVQLPASGELGLPAIRMTRGALLSGRATADGRIAGQIKVVLTSVDNSQRGGVRLEATTDNQGRYRMPARVPPGEYVLRGAVVDAAEPEAQIARQLLQMQRSSTTVSVPPGQSSVERDIDLPPDR